MTASARVEFRFHRYCHSYTSRSTLLIINQEIASHKTCQSNSDSDESHKPIAPFTREEAYEKILTSFIAFLMVSFALVELSRDCSIRLTTFSYLLIASTALPPCAKVLLNKLQKQRPIRFITNLPWEKCICWEWLEAKRVSGTLLEMSLFTPRK